MKKHALSLPASLGFAAALACSALVGPFLAPALRAQPAPSASSAAASAPTSVSRPSVLFIGNSFFYGAGSPVRFYRAHTVTDLNGEGTGGVPALFQAFALQASRVYAVSLETAGGKGFDFHVQTKSALLARPWDHVVAQSYSTLDQKKPGDPTVLVTYAKQLAELLAAQNPRVDFRLVATWSRADQTYLTTGHWHGQPIERMALDIRAAYDQAAAGAPIVHAVIPVGQAFNRAMATGVADPNPYDGLAFGQIDLWTHDHYHASAYGYYLEALMIFGDLTGLDPRSLGKAERTALELGFTAEQAVALQKIAYDELAVTTGRPALRSFTPVPLPK